MFCWKGWEYNALCGIFNFLPEDLRRWTGTKETFKSRLDMYMSAIPDQPEYAGMIPGVWTLLGSQSNSIDDWSRVLDAV